MHMRKEKDVGLRDKLHMRKAWALLRMVFILTQKDLTLKQVDTVLMQKELTLLLTPIAMALLCLAQKMILMESLSMGPMLTAEALTLKVLKL
jgi:hypothetical protein